MEYDAWGTRILTERIRIRDTRPGYACGIPTGYAYGIRDTVQDTDMLCALQQPTTHPTLVTHHHEGELEEPKALERMAYYPTDSEDEQDDFQVSVRVSFCVSLLYPFS